jgi:hypothetical protein
MRTSLLRPPVCGTYASGSSQEPVAWTLTGFLVSFTADLYYRQGSDDMRRYSTAPGHFSVGMVSWLPHYFPLQQPVVVLANTSVKVNVWRQVDETRVWYEWSACVHRQGEVLITTSIISTTSTGDRRTCLCKASYVMLT